MVTAIEAVKRQYREYLEAAIEDHAVIPALMASPQGISTSGDHRETVVHEESHRGFSTFGIRPERIVPKVSYRTFSITRDHPEAGIYRMSLEGNLCVFCSTLPERRMEDQFAEFVAEWQRGTGGLSSPRAIAGHPAYQQIIKMGAPAIPMILQELQENGGWWYPALRILTGENPVPEEAKGQPPLNREAWLEWGRRNGYPQT